MMSTWVAILLFSFVGTVFSDELPIVDVIREVIFETNQDLAKNHKDHLKLPNLGIFSWDPIKLRNGSLGVFSTMEFTGDINVTENDTPDGAMEFVLDLNFGLGTISLQYDFRISVLGLFVKTGTVELKTSNDTLHANVTVSVSKEGKCSATLNSARVTELDGFKMEIQPKDIHYFPIISQALVNFLTPKALPLVNLVIKKAIGTNMVQEKFSKTLCKKLPF